MNMETNIHHNFLANAEGVIFERYAKAKEASRQSLEDLRVVGDMLNDAKEVLKDERGAFGKWCEKLPFDKAWRARLMKLAANWDAIIAAVMALPEDKRKWSVDGVLAAWQASLKAEKSAGEGGETGPKAERAKRETEAERLRRELAEALAEIERLRAENEALKGGEQPKAKAKTKAEEPKADNGLKVDAATKARAKKVHALWKAPGTNGEGEAAKARLQGMADKFGVDLDTFLAACGLA